MQGVSVIQATLFPNRISMSYAPEVMENVSPVMYFLSSFLYLGYLEVVVLLFPLQITYRFVISPLQLCLLYGKMNQFVFSETRNI